MTGPAVPASYGPREAEPIENFTTDARSILDGLFGKPDPKDLPTLARAAVENVERVRAIAARKFADDDGQVLLEALCDATLRRPFFITQLGMTIDQTAMLGAFREGSAAATYLLLSWIAEGRKEQPPEREANHAGTSRKRRRKTRR